MHNVVISGTGLYTPANSISNEELVQSALRSITGAMEAIKDGLNPKPTYERKGAMAQGKAEGGALVSREA